MIRLSRALIEGVRAAEAPEDLFVYLQKAVELEHSTIPPYLTAMFSLKPGSNRLIGEMIRSIVVEEMLHMTIAGNILIAIGGRPVMNRRGFVPHYPGPLPMDIGGLTVGIEAFSLPLVKTIFMAIEQPEDEIPVKLLAGERTFATIGEFYDAIKEKIDELEKAGVPIFADPRVREQVLAPRWFPPHRLYPIVDAKSACAGIDLIKLEGEGTAVTPFQSPGDPAHFYKFGSIVAGKALIQTLDGGYAYGGAPIPFDPAGVWPLRPNCRVADFAVGTQARTRIEQFAYNYTALLNALHEAFNGHPERLDAAIGVMYDLRVLSAAMMQTDAGGGLTVGPSYELIEVQGGMP